MLMKIPAALLAVVWALCLAPTAFAGIDVDACVANAVELEAALMESITNGATTDTIMLRTGTYASAGNPFGAGGSFANQDSITVEGGWSGPPENPCQSRSDDPTLTVIDGQNVRGGLQLTHQAGAGGMTVRNLTFQNGHRQYNPQTFSNDRGAGLYITGSAGNYAQVLVERCIFRNNYASFQGGGLVAASDGGSVTVRNNLFVGNTASENAAMHVFGNGDFSYVSNNTVTGNIASSTNSSNAAFGIAGDNAVTLTNNVFWDNTTGTQKDFGGTDLLLIKNDIQKPAGIPGAGSSGNISIDPIFISASDFRLAGGSPLIDIGVNDPLGGLPALDLEGVARIQGGTVDLGAYEFSLVFLDGFEN
jgi:hypothetical protein